MPISNRPSLAQMENLISLLAHSDAHGGVIANLVDAGLFEGDYALIAERCIAYHKQHHRAPTVHTGDLFADIIEDVSNGRRATAFRRILLDMQLLAPKINSQYVLHDLQNFTRQQLLKDAVIRAAEALSQGSVDISGVEEIIGSVLRARTVNFDRGVRLDDDLDPFLDWLDTRHEEFVTGIDPLDAAKIVPYRGALMLFIAGKGRGKTWFLVNIGKMALILHKRVLHLSLENDEQETRMRYYQALFAVARHRRQLDPFGQLQDYLHVSTLERALDNGQVKVSIGHDRITPSFSFDSPDIRAELETRLFNRTGARFGSLLIKRFPNRMLSVDGLEAYLDTLEQVDGFIPDILLLDYAKLLKLPSTQAQERRHAIGDNMERLRALAIQRNLALVTADQLNRPGYGSKVARSDHIGEDWSQVHTADIVLTHSATDSELRHGLCRLHVSHARSDRDKFDLVLTQNFSIGQFCLDADYMPSTYMTEMMPGRDRPDGALASAIADANASANATATEEDDMLAEDRDA